VKAKERRKKIPHSKSIAVTPRKALMPEEIVNNGALNGKCRRAKVWKSYREKPRQYAKLHSYADCADQRELCKPVKSIAAHRILSST
jgi:hypothetical protein